VSFESFLEDAIRRAVREELLKVLADRPIGNTDRRVTRTEAASNAGVSPATVRAWVKAGKLPEYGKGRGVRYSLSEVLSVRPDRLDVNIEQRAEEILRRKHG
jgi:hypothetical protein